MKKKVILFGMPLLIIVALISCKSVSNSEIGRAVSNVFSKSDITYQATTRFMYSTDGGQSWSETIQEVPVNSTYWLAIEMQISQSEGTKDEKEIVATITIPNTNILDCQLDDHPGVSITGKLDAVTNAISYDFKLISSVTPHKYRVTFECKPLEKGRTKVEVVYDDKVNPSWDATGSIKYV